MDKVFSKSRAGREIFLTICLVMIFFGMIRPAFGAENNKNCWSIGKLKYSGGGDWYSDPTGLPNLVKRARKDLGKEICPEPVTVSLLDGELYNSPVLYMTGHGNVYFSEEEKQVLREYLYRGGLLFADDNYGMDSSFRREISAVFPQQGLSELPASHPVFTSFYNMKKQVPKIHQHDGKRARLLGVDMLDRTLVVYSYEADLGDGWEDPEVHNVPADMREKALRMGVNIIAWYLQGQRSK